MQKDNRKCLGGDEQLMRRAIELLQMYHARHIEDSPNVDYTLAEQRLCVAVGLMEECAEAFSK